MPPSMNVISRFPKSCVYLAFPPPIHCGIKKKKKPIFPCYLKEVEGVVLSAVPVRVVAQKLKEEDLPRAIGTLF